MRTAILSDTNSGITAEEAKKLGIFVMPMPIIIEDETYYEGKNITEEEFYEALATKNNVSTSQPSPGDVMDQWEELFAEGYDEVVYIPMSSGLSNSCAAALGYAQEYDGRVQVVDNHRISVTLRDSALMAKKLADEGKTAAQIKELLEKDTYNSTIYISVNTLEYLKRGGRITPAAALIGTVLNIKPVLTIQGEKLDAFSKARSMKKCQARMVEGIRSDLEKRFPEVKYEQLSIGAAGAALSEEDKQAWMEELREAFPGATVYYGGLSASIGCHVGPGSVGVGVTII